MRGDTVMSPDDKIAKVMSEFHAGTLRSSSGQPVTSKRQAMAIALSEAGMSQDEYDKRSCKQ